MTRALAFAALVVALGVTGCRHARHVGDAAPGDGAQEGGRDGRAAPARGGGAGREQGSSGEATRSRVPPRDGRPAVAASPEGLMNPGSTRRIQEALVAKGLLDRASGELDEATSGALRKFQRAEGIAATGAPDRETLRRLGVDPQDVYRTVPEGDEARAPEGTR